MDLCIAATFKAVYWKDALKIEFLLTQICQFWKYVHIDWKLENISVWIFWLHCCTGICKEKKVKVLGFTFDKLRDNERQKDLFQSSFFLLWNSKAQYFYFFFPAKVHIGYFEKAIKNLNSHLLWIWQTRILT